MADRQVTAVASSARVHANAYPATARHFPLGFSLALLFIPSFLAVTYFGFLASDRYVSESQFIVRTAAKPVGAGGLGALLQMSGLGLAPEEVFSVQSFITSRNGASELSKQLPIQGIYGPQNADWVARYPSFFYGSTIEELHQYLEWMIDTTYSTKTGITTLRVQAFEPEDAKRISLLLLELGERKVNQLNARIRKDALESAQSEVQRYEQRLIAAQIELTRFRNAELLIDAAKSSVVVTELVGRLGAELAQAEATVRQVSSSATNNPLLPSLRQRASALRTQILRERRRISDSSEGLAEKLATYERLVLDREFAKQSLAAAIKSLEAAQQEARRQQLYLELVVEPVAADKAMAPRRTRLILSAFGLNIVLALMAWLIYAGVREHALQE